MTKKRKTALRLVVGLALLGALVYAGRRHLDRLGLILEAPLWALAALVLLFLAGRVIHGASCQCALRALGLPISLFEAAMLALRVNLANLFVPQGGTGVTAVYLKLRHALPYARFASFFVAVNVVQFACFGIIGLVCLGWLRVGGAPWSWPLALVLAGLAGPAAVVVVLPGRLPRRWRGRVADLARRFLDSLAALRRDRGTLVALIGLQSAVLAMLSLRIWVCLRAVGSETTLAGAVLIAVLGQVGMRFGPTPGGLGFREGAMAVVSTLLGGDTSLAVAAALLDRAVATACSLLIGQIGFWHLFRPVRGAAAAEEPAEEAPAAGAACRDGGETALEAAAALGDRS
ncbi:MAG: lysylphosphatidylglycerol synthase transmembrane domain-containing protein [bacterium]